MHYERTQTTKGDVPFQHLIFSRNYSPDTPPGFGNALAPAVEAPPSLPQNGITFLLMMKKFLMKIPTFFPVHFSSGLLPRIGQDIASR